MASLQELRRAHPGALCKFFHEHNCRSAEPNQERIDAIYQAGPVLVPRLIVAFGTRRERFDRCLTD